MLTSILVTFLRLFSSCPGAVNISGKVISHTTETSIEAATIELWDIDRSVQSDESSLSDENGNFKARSIMRRMVFGLPKYRIRITKTGYQVLEMNIKLDKKLPGLFRLIEI